MKAIADEHHRMAKRIGQLVNMVLNNMQKNPPIKHQWIIETVDERCLSCRQRKNGRFLIIYLDNIGIKKYLALCEECLRRI